MSNKPRIFIPHYYFHTFNRAISGMKLFYDQKDCYFFIETFLQAAEEMDIYILAWILMSNHFHMVLKQNQTGREMADFFRKIKVIYTHYFNRKYHRYGPLFSSRYQAIVLEENYDVYRECRYVHANPVTGNLTDRAESWIFSNCRAFQKQEFWEDSNNSWFSELFNSGNNYIETVNEYGLIVRSIRTAINPQRYQNIVIPDFMLFPSKEAA